MLFFLLFLIAQHGATVAKSSADEFLAMKMVQISDFYPAGDSLIILDSLIDKIHGNQSLWIADQDSFFKLWTVDEFSTLLMRKRSNLVKHVLPIHTVEGDRGTVPEYFDARQKWYDCQTVSEIRDQGKCGSCWAFGASSAISDRICIASKGKLQNMVSARDLMTCCSYCNDVEGKPCGGGEAQDAYYYWNATGIVSGGNWMTQLGCQPYPIPISLTHGNTSHTNSSSANTQDIDPVCKTTCTEKKYPKQYEDDKMIAKDVYRIDSSDLKGVMLEIMNNGPITASYNVYSDFAAYKEGVYVKTSDHKLGEHSVTIIGWGTEKGVDYWLCKNSWNKVWGHHGFFKIRRGVNECGIENEFVTGIPLVET